MPQLRITSIVPCRRSGRDGRCWVAVGCISRGQRWRPCKEWGQRSSPFPWNPRWEPTPHRRLWQMSDMRRGGRFLQRRNDRHGIAHCAPPASDSCICWARRFARLAAVHLALPNPLVVAGRPWPERGARRGSALTGQQAKLATATLACTTPTHRCYTTALFPPPPPPLPPPLCLPAGPPSRPFPPKAVDPLPAATSPRLLALARHAPLDAHPAAPHSSTTLGTTRPCPPAARSSRVPYRVPPFVGP